MQYIDTLEGPGRTLNDAEQCSNFFMFETELNNDSRRPPFHGIMFEVLPRAEMELVTIELDIRVDETSDLSVQVYTLNGSYLLLDAYDGSRWTRVANTKLVPIAGGSTAIIRTHEFEPIQLGLRERRSFYITMTGPHIDYIAEALQRPGSLQKRTDELEMFVGSGFDQHNFPGTVNRNLSPQFAGMLHFNRRAPCNGMTTTTVEFRILVDQIGTSELMTQISPYVDTAVRRTLENIAQLQSLVTKFSLGVSLEARTARASFTGSCPQEWGFCPDSFLRSQIAFSHNVQLNPGALRHEFYKARTTFVEELAKELTQQRMKVEYVGYRDVSAKITLILSGVPDGQTMDDVQLEYLSRIVVDFLQENVHESIQVLQLAVESQFAQGSNSPGIRRQLQTRTSRIRIEGEILGGLSSLHQVDDRNFKIAIEDAFQKQSQAFISKLFQEGLRPSSITEDYRIGFFESVTSIGGSVSLGDTIEDPRDPLDGTIKPVEPKTEDNMNIDSTIMVAAVGGLVGLICLFGVVWFCRRWLRSRQRKRDKMNMKEFRAERDKLDRQAAASTATMKVEESPRPSGVVNEELGQTRSLGRSNSDADMGERTRRAPGRSKSADDVDLMRIATRSAKPPAMESNTGENPEERKPGETNEDGSHPVQPGRSTTDRLVPPQRSISNDRLEPNEVAESSDGQSGAGQARQSPGPSLTPVGYPLSPANRVSMGHPGTPMSGRSQNLTPWGRGAPMRSYSTDGAYMPTRNPPENSPRGGRGAPNRSCSNDGMWVPPHGRGGRGPGQGYMAGRGGRGTPMRSYSDDGAFIVPQGRGSSVPMSGGSQGGRGMSMGAYYHPDGTPMTPGMHPDGTPMTPRMHHAAVPSQNYSPMTGRVVPPRSYSDDGMLVDERYHGGRGMSRTPQALPPQPMGYPGSMGGRGAPMRSYSSDGPRMPYGPPPMGGRGYMGGRSNESQGPPGTPMGGRRPMPMAGRSPMMGGGRGTPSPTHSYQGLASPRESPVVIMGRGQISRSYFPSPVVGVPGEEDYHGSPQQYIHRQHPNGYMPPGGRGFIPEKGSAVSSQSTNPSVNRDRDQSYGKPRRTHSYDEIEFEARTAENNK